MNCARCGRRLRTATVTITTREKALIYGPRCAQRMGLVKPHKAKDKKVLFSVRRVHKDPMQMELIA